MSPTKDSVSGIGQISTPDEQPASQRKGGAGLALGQGTHTELLKKKGYYHELYTRQYEDESAARILS